MKISDEAIEAAAHALFEKELGRPMEVADEGLYAEDIVACREDARAALEAAAPHMAADALRLADKWQAEFPYKASELRKALGATDD